MQKVRFDSKEAIAAGFVNPGHARNVPERVHAAAPATVSKKSDAEGATPRRGWMGAGLRFLRNAAVGLALVIAVPIGVVQWSGGLPGSFNSSGVRERLADVERLRPLAAPSDASITPMEAGIALRSLQGPKSNGKFALRDAGTPFERPWATNKLTATMFTSIRLPSSTSVSAQWIMSIVPGGFSAEELSYLRAIAEAPIWQAFDRVSHASTVDVIGGQYVLPFQSNAFAPAMSIPRFADTKQLAEAGVSRAAYYLAIGQPERAEAALRSVVSFGFAMIDNGTHAIDALIGRVILGIGRSGLEQFMMASHAETSQATYEAIQLPRSDAPKSSAQTNTPLTGDALRQRLLSDARNETLPRSLRLGSLSQLSFASCGNVKEMLFGPGADVQAAFAEAGTTLARFPSEKAYLNLLYESSNRVPITDVRSVSKRLIVGAATVASTVLNNPRVAACTRIAVEYR